MADSQDITLTSSLQIIFVSACGLGQTTGSQYGLNSLSNVAYSDIISHVLPCAHMDITWGGVELTLKSRREFFASLA